MYSFYYVSIFISLLCLSTFHIFGYNRNDIKYRWNKKLFIATKVNIETKLITYKDGFKMYIYSDNDIVSSRIKKYKVWSECETLHKLWNENKLYKINGYYVDVGANIGTCSLKFINLGIKTISFEPVVNNLHLFTKSLLLNKCLLPKIELYTIGLNNVTKILPMYINNDMGGSSFYGNWSVNLKGITYSKVFTLDDIYKHKLNISLLKIDVEGYEYNVLQGAKNLLKNHRIKSIFLEINCFGLISVGMKESYIYRLLYENKYNLSTSKRCKGHELFDLYAVANEFY